MRQFLKPLAVKIERKAWMLQDFLAEFYGLIINHIMKQKTLRHSSFIQKSTIDQILC